MNILLERILSELSYYDVLDVALTAQELFLALPANKGADPAFEEFEEALDIAFDRRLVASAEGFYCLPGREALIALRKTRYILAEAKFARARSFLRLARHAPYLRAAFVCNTLARSNARPESDIDLFLVVAPGRLWLVRMMVAGLAVVLRVRPTKTESADRICLSFFVTSDALDLRPLALADDVYLAHWLHELYPVYDEAGVALRISSENGWMRRVRSKGGAQTASPRRAVGLFSRSGKKLIERCLDAFGGDYFERLAKRWQQDKFPPALRAGAEASFSGVVLSDKVLKFHERDRRADIRDSYQEKYAHALRTLA